MRRFLFLFFFLSTLELSAAEFVTNIEEIKREIDHTLLELHLKDPTKNPLPGAVFGSLVSYKAPTLLGDTCLEFDLQKTKRELLLIIDRNFLLTSSPKADESKKREPSNTEYIIFLVENSEPVDHVNASGPMYEVSFPSEFMEEKIKFANKFLEFRYSSGYRTLQGPILAERGGGVSDLEWLRQGDIKIDVLPNLRLSSQVLISESLVTQGEPLRGNVVSNLFTLKGVKFETNYVNVKMNASTSLSEKTRLNLTLNVDSEAERSSAALFSKIDFTIPSGAKLLVFSNIRAATEDILRPRDQLSAGAGVELKTKQGIKFSGEVNDVGTGSPQIRGTISLPAE